MSTEREQAEKGSAILVRGVNWIGDAVMTMPALRALKNACPGIRITLLVNPWVSDLFEKDLNVDEIIIYKEEHRGVIGKFRLAGLLRKHNFSMAVLFQNAIDAAIVAYLAGIKERIGYDRDGRGFLLTRPLACSKSADREIHPVQYYLDLLRVIGIDPVYSLPWIYLALEERLKARSFFGNLARPVVGIAPGAYGSAARRWPSDRFAAVVRRVTEELCGSVIIFGGKSEIGTANDIMQHVPDLADKGLIISMAGKTTVRELAAYISETDVLISNDSGPLYIGYAAGTPVVGLFGPVDPRIRLSGKGTIAIRKDVICSPCFRKTCDRESLICMEAIDHNDVLDAVRKLIGSRRAVFFDRDGTLCRDPGYLNKIDDLEIFPDIEKLGKLKDRGFALIGISNQSGIARGLIKKDFVEEVNGIFINRYGFDDFYYCPHHPDEHCSCRKPEPGLFFKARADHNIDLKNSFVVGDKDTDMILARAVGAKAILVKTGNAETSPYADAVVEGLNEAVRTIVSMSNGQ